MATALSEDDLPIRSFSRPTWAEIDLAALRSNARAMYDWAGVPLITVIKADAYGHGAVPIARALLTEDATQMLAVASVDEGLQLREAGITMPILLLSAFLPAAAEVVVHADLTPTIFTLETARALDLAASRQQRVANIHVKLDTGMTRLGVWHEEAALLLREILALPNLHVVGLYTHLACADETDDDYTPQQLAAFKKAQANCQAVLAEYSAMTIHAANSAAALRYATARFDAVRIGIALYGVSPLPEGIMESTPALQPVMTLASRITHVREVPAGTAVSYGATWRSSRPSCLATVPIGYADGYSRLLSNRAQVLVRGERCAVVGRVTMDQILVDCSHLQPKLQIGETVILWGRDLPVQEVAQWAETIPYELLCGVSRRVPRVYRNFHAS